MNSEEADIGIEGTQVFEDEVTVDREKSCRSKGITEFHSGFKTSAKGKEFRAKKCHSK